MPFFTLAPNKRVPSGINERQPVFASVALGPASNILSASPIGESFSTLRVTSFRTTGPSLSIATKQIFAFIVFATDAGVGTGVSVFCATTGFV